MKWTWSRFVCRRWGRKWTTRGEEETLYRPQQIQTF